MNGNNNNKGVILVVDDDAKIVYLQTFLDTSALFKFAL